jgi:hypothetical protein
MYNALEKGQRHKIGDKHDLPIVAAIFADLITCHPVGRGIALG